MVLLLAKQIITLYHAVQKLFAKDQHALITSAHLSHVMFIEVLTLFAFCSSIRCFVSV